MKPFFWGRAVCCNGITVSVLGFLTAGSGARRARPRSNIAVYCPDGDLGDSEPDDVLRPNCGLAPGKEKRFDCTGHCSGTFLFVGGGKRCPGEILRPRGGAFESCVSIFLGDGGDWLRWFGLTFMSTGGIGRLFATQCDLEHFLGKVGGGGGGGALCGGGGEAEEDRLEIDNGGDESELRLELELTESDDLERRPDCLVRNFVFNRETYPTRVDRFSANLEPIFTGFMFFDSIPSMIFELQRV
jgi:hypothetical protein